MEVVQGGALVCAPRGPSSSAAHQPLRLAHHRLDGEIPATAALHVQTEEGGGGGSLDPSWWRMSASGSWDGGERRMRYGKLIDDRPGSIPGAVQRRKLELLETHAPGASMRVMHSQSTASWRQDGGDLFSLGMSTSGAMRSVLSSSSSSSTRVTSFRQWSSNFSQTSSNVATAHQQETRPAATEFGNLELVLNPLDVSFLRTRGNVGRSGSIGSRRPPTRTRRSSSDAPSPDSSGEKNSDSVADRESPMLDLGTSTTHDEPSEKEKKPSETTGVATSPASEGIRESVARLMSLGWRPPGPGIPPAHPPLSPLRSPLRPKTTPLHRKRSVSSEDLRGAEDGDEGALDHAGAEDHLDNEGVKWERGASVRRSLPSSEWRSAVGPADGGLRPLRPRNPLKSSSVPALGGPSASNRRSSLVTAESLREMKGRLKHRGSLEMLVQKDTTSQTSVKVGEKSGNDGQKAAEVISVSLRTAKEENGQDDRRKSWSMGSRSFEKREVPDGQEDVTATNRRRSYAFEFSDEGKDSLSSEKKETDWVQFQSESRGDLGHRSFIKGISSESNDFPHSRVNEMLKKWSCLTQTTEQEKLNRNVSSSSPTPTSKYLTRSQDIGSSSVKNSTTTWLDQGDSLRLEKDVEMEVNGYSTPASALSGAKTTLRVTHPKSLSSFKEEVVNERPRSLDKSSPISDELLPSTIGHLVEDYSCPRGLSPIDWGDSDSKTVLSSSKELAMVEPNTSTKSSGISITFSNTEGGDTHNNNSTRNHYSVTHLENKEGEGSKADGGYKIRSSKKVEFSKTEVHFAAESGRFHIVETAGKPPPSNNFRRRRRSPTGTLNVDSSNGSVVGGRGVLGGASVGQSTLSNGMRFGDSPYEKRLLAGTDGADMLPSMVYEDDLDGESEAIEDDKNATDVETPFGYTNTSSRLFEDLEVGEEKETKDILVKLQDLEIPSTSPTLLQLGAEDAASEKRWSILRGNPVVSNLSSWKLPQKPADDQDDDMKPKFGGVRLRPVISPEIHTRINLSSLELTNSSRNTTTEKSLPESLSPGQMELQKLLKSLRPVTITSYGDSMSDLSTQLGTQVANGGGMEVRISSGNQTAVTNTVLIGDDSIDVLTPLSVAQRVREVEERRQREISSRVANSQRQTNRATGQFSTRVTLGPGSSSVVSMEPHILTNKLSSQPLSPTPSSPKTAAKTSTHNKISRLPPSQDKVGPLRIVRKSIREETCRVKQRSEILAPSREKTAPKAEAVSAPPPIGRRFDEGWQVPLSPLHIQIDPLEPRWTRKLSATPSKVEDLWFRGLLTTGKPSLQPPPSASWPSARGFGRVGDDRAMLKSPSLILQTMLSTAFAVKEAKETNVTVVTENSDRREGIRTAVEALRSEEVLEEKSARETLMSGDKLQPKLSILRALYRDASEEECSDAYEATGRLLGGRRGGAEEGRLGDGGSVLSGSWRRMRKTKQQQQQSSNTRFTDSVSTPCPKPVPRKQSGKTKSLDPPRPPPRIHRNNFQSKMRRIDGRGRVGGGRQRAEEKARRRGGSSDCGGKGDASGLFGDGDLQRNPLEIKESARVMESRSRSEHSQEVPGITCIALGFQGRAKGSRERKEDFSSKEYVGTGLAMTESPSCKIFSALSVSREEEGRRIGSKVEGLKYSSTRERSPEDSIHSRQKERKSSSPSRHLNSAWSGSGSRTPKDEGKGKSDPGSKDAKSQKKGKEIATSAAESSRKSHYTVLSSSPPENKIFSGILGGLADYQKEKKEDERDEDEMNKFSIKLKVLEKRLEAGSQGKSSKSTDHLHRRSSTDSGHPLLEKTKRGVDAGKFEAKASSPTVSRSPRLSETTRLLHSKQVSATTTTARPASPRLPLAGVGDSVAGVAARGGSPSSERAVRKRVRRRASGSGGVRETSEAGSERRKGRKNGGEEMSEESAILAELTRAADEILNAVNGYSDDLTSDDDAIGGAAAARSKRRATRTHSKRTSSSSSSAGVREVTSRSTSSGTSGGVQKTGNSAAVVATRGKEVSSKTGGRSKEHSGAKEKSVAKESGTGHESSKSSGAVSRGHQRVGSPVAANTPSYSSTTAVRDGNTASSVLEKGQRSKQQHHAGGNASPRVKSAMTRIEPTSRVAEVKLIEKRPPLPPGGQRRGKEGLKERSEVHTRGTHGKTKPGSVNASPLTADGDGTKGDAKRTMNIARALEAVMPDPRGKTRKIERKTDEHLRKESQTIHPGSPQSSPGISLSLERNERKKVASSREGDKTTRRGVHQSSNSPT